MDPEFEDGYMDGRYWQEADPTRGERYDDGYIQGSSDYLDSLSDWGQ